jgi:hypothetical protein
VVSAASPHGSFATTSDAGSSGSCCAAVHVFGLYGFWRSNLLSFQCEAAMDVFVLLNFNSLCLVASHKQ